MTDHSLLARERGIDKLLRYEPTINRQLNHAIAELERVPARRKGEAWTPIVELRNKAKNSFNFSGWVGYCVWDKAKLFGHRLFKGPAYPY
jgi:hypothetical protein